MLGCMCRSYPSTLSIWDLSSQKSSLLEPSDVCEFQTPPMHNPGCAFFIIRSSFQVLRSCDVLGRAESVLLFMVKYREMGFDFQISILERESRAVITLNPEDGFSLHSQVCTWLAWIAPSSFHLSKGFRSYLSRIFWDCDGFLNIGNILLGFSVSAHWHSSAQSPA